MPASSIVMFRLVLLFAAAAILTSCTATPAPVTATGQPAPLSRDVNVQAIGLGNRIAALSPTIDPAEAQHLSVCAFSTVRRLAGEYQMVWPAAVQNYLIKIGKRKRGYCFHWAEDLMVALARLKLQTIELHWVEAFPRTAAEHNVVVVTARNQPFYEGILLDGWRYNGNLYSVSVKSDMKVFEWHENKAQYAAVLARAVPPIGAPDPGTR